LPVSIKQIDFNQNLIIGYIDIYFPPKCIQIYRKLSAAKAVSQAANRKPGTVVDQNGVPIPSHPRAENNSRRTA